MPEPLLSGGQRARCLLFLERLYKANRSLNLTRVPPEQAWERHIEESLDLLPGWSWPDGARVLDLGSGGGIPGIPLAIALPQIRPILLERTMRKAEFLRGCLPELSLPHCEVVAADARELSRRPTFSPVEAVVSRAAAPPPLAVRLALGLLRPGGVALLQVARSLDLGAEIPRAAGRFGTVELYQGRLTRCLRVTRTG